MSPTAALSRPEPDTRTRIIETAERLFRDVGYQKTTVADIAKALRMSPANVYRFFESKKAVNEAVAERITGEIRDRLAAIVRSDRPAAARMRELLRTLNTSVCELGVAEAKMQEMVAIAMDESWSVIRAHIEKIDGLIADLVRDGIATGEFRTVEPEAVAPCIRAAMLRFCHPALLAQCADIPRPSLDDQIAFILAAIRAAPSGR